VGNELESHNGSGDNGSGDNRVGGEAGGGVKFQGIVDGEEWGDSGQTYDGELKLQELTVHSCELFEKWGNG
jgi:hypothetical protein